MIIHDRDVSSTPHGPAAEISDSGWSGSNYTPFPVLPGAGHVAGLELSPRLRYTFSSQTCLDLLSSLTGSRSTRLDFLDALIWDQFLLVLPVHVIQFACH